ncbi:MAG: hypothetical protein JRG90_12550 [Deltaproteobacteria bacterium]|nr:hypothetical protein [Deltaproteobacteria bacterium]
MSNNDGWIGDMDQVLHYLDVVGADKDDGGGVKIYGCEGFIGSMGDNSEVVVPATAEYSIDGHRSNLAAGLRSTSYGVGAKVFA